LQKRDEEKSKASTVVDSAAEPSVQSSVLSVKQDMSRIKLAPELIADAQSNVPLDDSLSTAISEDTESAVCDEPETDYSDDDDDDDDGDAEQSTTVSEQTETLQQTVAVNDSNVETVNLADNLKPVSSLVADSKQLSLSTATTRRKRKSVDAPLPSMEAKKKVRQDGSQTNNDRKVQQDDRRTNSALIKTASGTFVVTDNTESAG